MVHDLVDFPNGKHNVIINVTVYLFSVVFEIYVVFKDMFNLKMNCKLKIFQIVRS